ncbi:netrin receptor UNC5B-b-like [Antedon mediterranea]|uniref:netrin receptor UNC5B-b-like n=1 Tax=Antedon mediterranea TaxID=105859 RepID=UPI003AF8ABB6
MNVNGQYTDKEISKYRKQLFEVLRESEQTNLSRVIAHYGMKSTEIKDIWDAVLMLEICGDLEDDNDKIKHFESLLKISSKEALTDQIVEVIVDSTGGTLHLKDEDIKLEIHSEAIEGEEVKVTLEIFSEEIDIPISHPRESIISPIIKCGPEGTTFNKPISLSFPHDAVNEENWEFTLLVKDHIQDEWKQIALTNDRKDVHFTLNKGLCCITLNHFSWYALKGHVRNAVHAKKRMLLGVFGKMLANDEYQLQTRLCKPSDVKKIKEDHRETGEQLLRPPVDLLFMYKKMKITVAAVSEQEWNVQDENVQTVTAEYLWRGTPLKTFLLRRSNSLENVLKATVSLSQESNRIDPVPVYFKYFKC